MLNDPDLKMILQPLLIIPAFMLLGVLIVLFNYWYYKKRLEPLIPLLGGLIKNNWGKAVLQGFWDGKSAEITLIPAGKNTPSKLQIALQNYFAFNLKIYSDNIIYQWSKKIGLMKEVEIGEPEFDKRYFLESRQPQEILSFLSTKKQEIIKSLNFTQLEFSPREIRYTLSSYSESSLQGQQVTDVLQKLNALTK